MPPNHGSDKIEMACDCGALRGHGIDLNPGTGRHLICMCKDCQAFARFLGREEILDQNGGTEIFQITPAQIRLEAGLDHLAAMRLGPKGAVRWYASCCNTPIANTTHMPGIPFAGVFCTFIKPRGTGSRDANPWADQASLLWQPRLRQDPRRCPGDNQRQNDPSDHHLDGTQQVARQSTAQPVFRRRQVPDGDNPWSSARRSAPSSRACPERRRRSDDLRHASVASNRTAPKTTKVCRKHICLT